MSIQQLLFSFHGRISRSTYWLKFYLPYMGIYILMIGLDIAIGSFDKEAGVGMFTGIFWLISIYSVIVINIKRIHDRNRIGWFLLLGLIPFVNIWVMIELGFLKGSEGSNDYGDDPLE